jgi:hypothetical protein
MQKDKGGSNICPDLAITAWQAPRLVNLLYQTDLCHNYLFLRLLKNCYIAISKHLTRRLSELLRTYK